MKKKIQFKELMKTKSKKLFAVNRDSFDKKVSQLPQDKFFYFELWEPTKQRTSPQNRYYWKCIIKPFADYCGYMMNESKEIEKHIFNEIKPKLKNMAHNRCKEQFLFTGYVTNTDIEIIRSTTDLDIDEFWEYIEQVRVWLKKEYNINTEDPKPYKEESYKTKKE